MHIQDIHGEIITTLQQYACRYAIAILGSIREPHVPHPYNTAVVIGPDGSIFASYAKIHPFSPAGESDYFDPGNNPVTCTVDGCTCGVAICYDLRFADLFRQYRDRGVHLVLVPSAWPATRQSHFILFSRCRAVEFQMYIAAANCTGTTPVDRYCGGSCVVNPVGEIIAEAGEGEELLFSEILPHLTISTQRSFPIAYDERPDIFCR